MVIVRHRENTGQWVVLDGCACGLAMGEHIDPGALMRSGWEWAGCVRETTDTKRHTFERAPSRALPVFGRRSYAAGGA